MGYGADGTGDGGRNNGGDGSGKRARHRSGIWMVFFPFLMFAIVQDLISSALMMLCYYLLNGGGAAADYITTYTGSVTAVVSACAAAGGAAVVFLTGGGDIRRYEGAYPFPRTVKKGDAASTGDHPEYSITMNGRVLRSPAEEAQDMAMAGRLQMAASVLLSLAAALSLNLLLTMSGLLSLDTVAQGTGMAQASAPLALGILCYGVVTPIAEEYVFRGVIFNRMRDRTSLVNAAAASAVLFGLYHGNASQTLYAGMMGVLFALIYARSARFVLTVFCHAAANILIFVLSSQGLYASLETPAWLAASLGVAALTEWYLLWERKRQNKNME